MAEQTDVRGNGGVKERACEGAGERADEQVSEKQVGAREDQYLSKQATGRQISVGWANEEAGRRATG